MNILMSVNKKYLDKAKTMLHSLRRNNAGHITVYLLNHCLPRRAIIKFRKYLYKRLNIALVVIDVSQTELDNMPLGNAHFSIEMYYRILAQFLLPKDMERILWLDADIIVCKDLHKFYYQSFDDKYLVACPDAKCYCKEVALLKKKIGLPAEHIYFNSGVLLLNLCILRKNTNLEEIVRTAYELTERLTYPDQDLLNYLYQGKVKFCKWEEYNYQVHEKKQIEKQNMDRISILHYAGDVKPWNFYHISQASMTYWKEIARRRKWGNICATAFLIGIWKIYMHCKIWVIVAKIRSIVKKKDRKRSQKSNGRIN